MFILSVTRGQDEGKKIPLAPGKTYTVGSDAGASLTLSDPKVLEGHCSIEAAEDSVILRNHTASAGTFVGQKKIAQARLKVPSAFRIGDTVLGLQRAPKAAPAPEPPDPMVGKIVGGYKINEVVGKGGMGTVYRATQLSLQRDVAVKVLAPRLAKDRSFVDLFVHEARAAAQLVHPNVVQVYDAGTEGDVSFFSMEFIGQGSVEEILATQKKMPWEEAILMVLEAAHGLDYAEGKGIVHRDIKPDNLMINDDGRVKIADLGLAKRGEGRTDQGIIGTPHFIPPEQALGKDVDTRADIYSLGCTFFRMITGRTLYSGKTAKEIVLKHIKEPPPAASSVDSKIPGDLEIVLATMLAKEPDQRYQTAKELIHALEEVCAHHGIKGSIIRKGVGKRVLIPLVVLLIAGGGTIWYLASRGVKTVISQAEIDARKEAQEGERKAKEAKERAERDARKTNAENLFKTLDGDYWKLEAQIRLKSTYDDLKTQDEQERRWLQLADRFEAFSKSEAATEFEKELELSTKALDKAKQIRKDLDRAKKSADSKRQWIADQLAKVQKIDQAERVRLAKLQGERRYADALALCDRLSREKPLKDDPFKEVEDAEWTSPIDSDLKEPAKEVKSVMDVIRKAREHFGQQKDVVPALAKDDWEAVLGRMPPEPATAPDAEIRAAIDELKAVEELFGAIENYVADAARKRIALEKLLSERTEKRLAEDRNLVKRELRRLRSLDPDAVPNFTMNCDFEKAIEAWNELIENLGTERYKGFAKERRQMLKWMVYLFSRFQQDVLSTTSNGDSAPLRSLDGEWPAEGSGRPGDFRFGRPPPGDPYSFTTRAKYKGRDEWAFREMTMDWIYSHAFHTPTGEPRWNEMTPVLEFALAAFCYETMQFEKSLKHFEKLSGDGRYGSVSKHLAASARREAAARNDFEKILKGIRSARSGTSDQAKELLLALQNFQKQYEGTLFCIEIMEAQADATVDFYSDGDVPDVPDAPALP